ncbi:MAG: glycosyltransferase family 39 protein [Gammaproteobacteria bacterium]|nr:glycosyltransferase family 39 protein [Gammaproteobacteria bacterium]
MLMSRLDHGLALVVVLAVAAAVALPGSARLPLDGHEVLVAQSVHEMRARGDWIVPYFNQRPRLNKPPLSYWLTGAVAGAWDGTAQVRPWQARTPSILAGLGLLAGTFLIGRRLFGASVGRDAALLLAASSAFFAYTHDARPDMLYACLCTAGLAAHVHAWKSDDAGRRRLAALGMWLAFALATLTKGPQLPAMLLAACVLGLLVARLPVRRMIAILRPLEGLVLLAAMTVPWWLAMRARLPAGALAHSQLAGSLLEPVWQHALDPYYLYRPLVLLLPWLALVPAALVALYRGRRRVEVPLIALLYLVPAITLGFGPQQRWFYLLPAIAPMAIALALGARHLNAVCVAARGRHWLVWLWPAHMLLVLAAAVYALVRAPDSNGLRLALATVLVLAAGYAWQRRVRGPRRRRPVALRITALMVAALLAGLGDTTVPWSRDRYDKAALGLQIGTQLPARMPVLAWSVNPNVFVYYANRHISPVRSPLEVGAALARAPNRAVAVITFDTQLAALRAFGEIETLATIPYSAARTITLARVSRPGG